MSQNMSSNCKDTSIKLLFCEMRNILPSYLHWFVEFDSASNDTILVGFYSIRFLSISLFVCNASLIANRSMR